MKKQICNNKKVYFCAKNVKPPTFCSPYFDFSLLLQKKKLLILNTHFRQFLCTRTGGVSSKMCENLRGTFFIWHAKYMLQSKPQQPSWQLRCNLFKGFKKWWLLLASIYLSAHEPLLCCASVIHHQP